MTVKSSIPLGEYSWTLTVNDVYSLNHYCENRERKQRNNIQDVLDTAASDITLNGLDVPQQYENKKQKKKNS